MTIDDYVAQLARFLTVPEATREAILQEVRDHLEDAAYQLAGTDRSEAEAQAV